MFRYTYSHQKFTTIKSEEQNLQPRSKCNCLTIKIRNQHLQELFVDGKLPPHRMMKKKHVLLLVPSQMLKCRFLHFGKKQSHKNLETCDEHEIWKHPLTTRMLRCSIFSWKNCFSTFRKKKVTQTFRPKPLSLDTPFLTSKNSTKSQVVKR